MLNETKSSRGPISARGAWPDPNVETVVDYAVEQDENKNAKSARYRAVIHMTMALSENEWNGLKDRLDNSHFPEAARYLKEKLPKSKPPTKKELNADKIIDTAMDSLSP